MLRSELFALIMEKMEDYDLDEPEFAEALTTDLASQLGEVQDDPEFPEED